MAGWHHLLDAHEFVWTPGVGDGQGGLERCDSWGYKESDTTEQLNWTELSTKERKANNNIKCQQNKFHGYKTHGRENNHIYKFKVMCNH